MEDGLVYLPGEPAKNNEDSDMPAPFRQRRYFYYLSGFVNVPPIDGEANADRTQV